MLYEGNDHGSNLATSAGGVSGDSPAAEDSGSPSASPWDRNYKFHPEKNTRHRGIRTSTPPPPLRATLLRNWSHCSRSSLQIARLRRWQSRWQTAPTINPC